MTWNGKNYRRKPRAIALAFFGCLMLFTLIHRSVDPGTASLIGFYSDLKFTKNSAKSIPLGGALPTSRARWCKPRFSAKYPKYFLLVARSEPCCAGDWMLSEAEGMKQHMRRAEISLAGQRETILFPHFTLLYKSHAQVRQVCEFFNMRRCEISSLGTIQENNYKSHNFKPMK